MLSAFLITLREGLEAALIVTIIAAYLVKTGRTSWLRPVWVGVGAAAALSAVVGLTVALGAANLSDRAVEAFEGVASLVAVGVLTWMIFWMRKQARHIKSDLEARTEQAITSGSQTALVLLAFAAVAREGLETVLFLYASFAQSASAVLSGGGAVAGLVVSVAIGYGIYRGGIRFNLRRFFQVTGALIIFVAAGLLATAMHEFAEVGWIAETRQAWDTSGIVSRDGSLGTVLRGMFGYRDRPTVLEAAVYFGYLIPALVAFLGVPTVVRRKKMEPARADVA